MSQNLRRPELDAILVDLLGTSNEEETRVYFQPPNTLTMEYPCIVYNLSDIDKKASNDQLYTSTNGYLVTVIDSDPDSEIPKKVLGLPMSRFVRHYTSDNLNHDVYHVYY